MMKSHSRDTSQHFEDCLDWGKTGTSVSEDTRDWVTLVVHRAQDLNPFSNPEGSWERREGEATRMMRMRNV